MRAASEWPTHSEVRLPDPENWVLFLSHQQPERLVVFVHGFRGGPVASWREFPLGGHLSDWWRASDLLFVGYASERDNILGVSNRLRQRLTEFYPRLPDELLNNEPLPTAPDQRLAERPHNLAKWPSSLPEELLSGSSPALREPGSVYAELLLAGHSLGGVIVRRLLCDVAEEWLAKLEADRSVPRPPLLDASVRLFSPASAGFRPGGSLGMLRALPTWAFVNVYLRRSTAYTDLQPASVFLRETRRRTEAALMGESSDKLSALRADILWANPDEVVLTERYTTDRPDRSADNTTHRSVCKPDFSYQLPWHFVESTP